MEDMPHEEPIHETERERVIRRMIKEQEREAHLPTPPFSPSLKTIDKMYLALDSDPISGLDMMGALEEDGFQRRYAKDVGDEAEGLDIVDSAVDVVSSHDSVDLSMHSEVALGTLDIIQPEIPSDIGKETAPVETAPAETRETRTFTLQEVRRRVEENNEILIIYDGKVYNLTKWIYRHPGGDLVLQHMKGRDATDEILVHHPPEIIKTRLPRFCIGTLLVSEEELNDPNTPLVSTKPISRAFRELNQKLEEAGLYETHPKFYVWEFTKFTGLWLSIIACVAFLPVHPLTYIGAGLITALLWQQAAFVAHDAGHNGIVHHPTIDMIIGVILADFLGGLSIGWWKLSHNVHHIVTNNPYHDPDIQHLPFLSLTERLHNAFSTFHNRIMTFNWFARMLVSVQHKLFYVVLLFGRFNLYVQSLIFLFTKPRVRFRHLEFTGLIVFLYWYTKLISYIPGTTNKLLYFIVSHCATILLHLQITFSHFSMDTHVVENETFAELAYRTTLDIDCGPSGDWIHGGLQFQIEHHLFPRIPRHNLRHVQPHVKALAKQFGLRHHCVTFLEGNKEILEALAQVARRVEYVFSWRRKDKGEKVKVKDI